MNFLIDLARHEFFQKADVHTGFITQHFDTLFPKHIVAENTIIQAAIGFIVNQNNAFIKNSPPNDPFAMNLSYRVNHSAVRTVEFVGENSRDQISVIQNDDGFKVKVNDGEWKNVHVKVVPEEGRFSLKATIAGNLFNYSCVITPERVSVFNEQGKTEFSLAQPKFLSANEVVSDGKSTLSAPMPGIIDKIFVNVGDEVQPGQSIAVIIAMKMEYVLKAAVGGKVKSIAGKVGDNIGKGVTIVKIE